MAPVKSSPSVKGLLQLILPKKKNPPAGTSQDATFLPSNLSTFQPLPDGFGHLNDLLALRQASDAPTLLKVLFQQDPDVSAAVNAFLTVADVEPFYVVKDLNGVINPAGHKMLDQVLLSMFTRLDYTQPSNFQLKQSLRALCADYRYMLLLRGAIASELVVDKTLVPSELRHVDMNTVRFTETAPGVFIPQQQPNGGQIFSIDIPTFFVSYFRRDPTSVYGTSFFLSAINSIAARQQVINDLYRIMQLTGFPRIEITMVEEVLRKNAPADCKVDDAKMNIWLGQRRAEIMQTMAGLRADQTLVHFDSITTKMMNEKASGASLNITSVIETLNSQNQAALKVMGTVIGRGEKGVNTASVESRIFSLNAEQINTPIADLLSQAFTLALRLQGQLVTVTVGFEHVELRPDLELEPQVTMRQTRLLQLLSLGIIDDDEFHLEMFNRVKPDTAPTLSGTGFMPVGAAVDTSKISPNTDPLGRSITPQPGDN